MEVALYLLPVTLGDTAIEKVLPSYNREIIVNIKHTGNQSLFFIGIVLFSFTTLFPEKGGCGYLY